MKSNPRMGISLFLIVAGIWFLCVEMFPAVGMLAHGAHTWPWQIIGAGLLLAILGLVFWVPGMMIPAVIIGGTGGLLYWQNLTGNWESWAYAWALIVVLTGLGMDITALMGRNRNLLAVGKWMAIVGLLQFVIFGAFLGGPDIIRQYWPVALILFGLFVLTQGRYKRQ